MNASIRRGPSRCLSGAGMPAGAAIRNNNIRVSAMSTTTTTTATRKRLGGLPATTTTLGLSSSPLLPGGARRRPLWTSSVVASAEGANGGNGGDNKKQQQQKQKQKQQQKQQQQRQQQKQPQQQQQKKKKEDKPDSPYKASVLLPETPFGMRANAVVREPELQKKWADEKTYERLLAKNKAAGGGTFTLHDGPPYANGDAHLGHALNKILKSFVVNWKLLSGQQARYVPGWDCHGLPIELKVLQSLPESERRALSPEGLRAKAREFAAKTVDQQRSQFRRYGLFGDWDSPYLTLEPRYEAAQLRVFGALALGGHVYRGRKPVHWSPSSRTALAEAELEYPPGHVSRSVYVSLPVEALAERAAAALVEGQTKGRAGGTEVGERGIALAVWTTTAWTLPANAAVAVNERLSYSVVDLRDGGPLLVVAEALAGAVAAKVKKASAAGEGGEEEDSSFEVLASFPGAALEGTTYRTPLDAPDPANPALRRVVVGGEYITTESGTGLVHTAPGHGQEDYGVGLRCGLPMPAPVDDAGRFTAEAGAGLEGLAVLKEGTAAVIDRLRESGNLLSEEKYGHKYPYDWRTKKPTIFRATAQWFVSVERFRADALAAAAAVEWVPSYGARRLSSMVEGRSDWCISRQRTWGVPIPVLYRKRKEGGSGGADGEEEAGEPLLTAESVEHLAQLVESHPKGSDVFWSASVEELLPPSLKGRADEFEKRQIETMDVWFDSGTSWAGVVEARKDEGLSFPADLYLEGSDQHRGWFQSSLLTSVAARGTAPYRAVLTHGFALDEKGAKMSKSLGNVVDPRTIIEGGKDQKQQPPYGADVLRLWAASVDYTGDVLMGPTVLAQVADSYRKLRLTLRFLLGNLHDFDPDASGAADASSSPSSSPPQKNGPVALKDLPLTDRYMLHRLARLQDEVSAALESYAFSRASAAVALFCGVELSNWYLDAAKDRLYLRGRGSEDRRACQTVASELLLGLVSCLAPLTPHLAEDAWAHLPWRKKTSGDGGGASGASGASGGGGEIPESVFLAGWRPPPRLSAEELTPEDVETMDALLAVRDEANRALQAAQRAGEVGAGLDARVAVFVAEGSGDQNNDRDAGLRAALERLQGAPNGADPLRYNLIVSQADLVSTEGEASSMPFVAEAEIQTAAAAARGAAPARVVVGTGRASGEKCQRCWSFSPLVGADAEHPSLCERCVPVVRELGIPSPVAAGGAATTVPA